MNNPIAASISAVAAALILGACASKGSANPKSAEARAQDETSAEYRRLAENASKRVICKRQAVLGTRVDTLVCLTQAEIDAQRSSAADVLRDIRASTPERPGTPVPNPPPSSAAKP